MVMNSRGITQGVSSQLRKLLQSTYFLTEQFGGIFRRFYGQDAWGPNEEPWARPIYHYLLQGTSMPHEPVRAGNQRPCCATFFMDSSLTQLFV